jgi:hypothetical protein
MRGLGPKPETEREQAMSNRTLRERDCRAEQDRESFVIRHLVCGQEIVHTMVRPATLRVVARAIQLHTELLCDGRISA